MKLQEGIAAPPRSHCALSSIPACNPEDESNTKRQYVVYIPFSAPPQLAHAVLHVFHVEASVLICELTHIDTHTLPGRTSAHLKATPPGWVVRLVQARKELYREIKVVRLGHSPVLAEHFGEDGPFWGRQYLFWSGGAPLTLIHEVFSPALVGTLL